MNTSDRIETGLQHFECSNPGKALNMEMLLSTHKNVYMGEAFSKRNEYGKACDQSVLIAQERTSGGMKSLMYCMCEKFSQEIKPRLVSENSTQEENPMYVMNMEKLFIKSHSSTYIMVFTQGRRSGM